VFARLGLARSPVVTVVNTVLTGAVRVWGLVSPAVLDALQFRASASSAGA